jgi:hypothetical protein
MHNTSSSHELSVHALSNIYNGAFNRTDKQWYCEVEKRLVFVQSMYIIAMIGNIVFHSLTVSPQVWRVRVINESHLKCPYVARLNDTVTPLIHYKSGLAARRYCHNDDLTNSEEATSTPPQKKTSSTLQYHHRSLEWSILAAHFPSRPNQDKKNPLIFVRTTAGRVCHTLRIR